MTDEQYKRAVQIHERLNELQKVKKEIEVSETLSELSTDKLEVVLQMAKMLKDLK